MVALMARTRRAWIAVLLGAAALALVDCGTEVTAPPESERPDTTVVALLVQPTSIRFLTLGDTARLTATATNVSGAVIPGAAVSWTTLDSDVATVDAQGLVRSAGFGNTTIRAASGTVSTSASVSVEQVVAGIRFSLDSVSFGELRRTQQVIAEPIDHGGTVVRGVDVLLASTNGNVAVVEAGGNVTARADGLAYVVATAGVLRDSIPVTVHAIGRRATVSGGEFHTCAIDPAGTAWCWGQGRLGQLGNGQTFTSSDVPVLATAPEALVEVSAGKDHTCAVAASGSAYCWGYNADGQLGDGTTSTHPSPVPIADTSHVQQVTAGGAHSCAATVGGRVLCWGSNSSGQLGWNGGGNSSSPGVVVHDSALIAVSAGDRHTCALATSGKAYCWGANSFGQLGDGTTSQSQEPVPVAGDLYFGALAAGRDHTCGVTTEGKAYCWGYNDWGAVGDGTTSPTSVPRAVSLDEVVVDIGAGAGFSCAVLATGEVRCWGYNAQGQLGEGTRTSRSGPTTPTLSWPAYGVGVGAFHACAESATGDLECWGSQISGATGAGDYLPRPVFARENQVEVSTGNSHACSRNATGDVFCWGWSGFGLLGGTTQYRGIPKPAGDWVGVTAGKLHSCAWTAAGRGYCWGAGGYALGNGGSDVQLTPTPIAGTARFSLITAGVSHTCGLDTGGRPWCWGSGGGDRLGLGSGGGASREPALVAGNHVFVDLDAGERLTCGIDDSARAWCWGVMNQRATDGPTLISEDLRLKTVSVGFDHACALDEGGEAYCWGGNDSGQLGSGTLLANYTPAPVVGGLVFTAVETNYQHSCGLTEAGRIYCWGLNSYGQLGNGGPTSNQSTPVAVAGQARYTQLAPGTDTSCALTDTGDVHCWGTQTVGEIGGAFILNPVPAASPPYRVEAAPWWVRTPPPPS